MNRTHFTPWTAEELSIKSEIQDMYSTMTNGGVNPDGARMTIQDAISVANAPLMFKRVITEVMQEAIEPVLVGTKLLTPLRFDGYGAQITFGTLGAIGNQNLDMADGQEYPEFGLQVGAGTATAMVGKSGLALKVTEEMIRYSQWDVLSMHVRQAGRALARHKEKKIFNMLNNTGVVVFDNAAPTTAEIGRTTGRNLSGAGNGSMTVEDLYDMYAKTLERGFTPNVVLVHPLAWAMFIKDPVMRQVALETGKMAGNWFNGLPQNVYPSLPAAWKKSGKMGASTSNPSQAEREGTQQSAAEFPINLPFGGLMMIPTHFVPFNANAKTTSIIMLDSAETGAIVIAEDPTMQEWDDPARDIKKIKIRERYGLAQFNEGHGISVARNISIEPNQIVLPPQATISGLAPIVQKP